METPNGQNSQVPPQEYQQAQPAQPVPNLAQGPAAYVQPQNIAQGNVPAQYQAQAPQSTQVAGNPKFWGVLTQTTEQPSGNVEKTMVAQLPQYGLLVSHSVVINGRPATALISLPSTKLIKHINPQTGEPFTDERGNHLWTIANQNI